MFHLSYLNTKIQLVFYFILRICGKICDTRSCKYGIRVLAKITLLTIFMQRPYSEPPGGLQQKRISSAVMHGLPCTYMVLLSNTTDGISYISPVSTIKDFAIQQAQTLLEGQGPAASAGVCERRHELVELC